MKIISVVQHREMKIGNPNPLGNKPKRTSEKRTGKGVQRTGKGVKARWCGKW